MVPDLNFLPVYVLQRRLGLFGVLLGKYAPKLLDQQVIVRLGPCLDGALILGLRNIFLFLLGVGLTLDIGNNTLKLLGQPGCRPAAGTRTWTAGASFFFAKSRRKDGRRF